MLRAAARVARAIRDAFEPARAVGVPGERQAAGQTVFHYHVHLVPRHDGDGMALSWPVKNPPREKLEEYAAKIRTHSLPGRVAEGLAEAGFDLVARRLVVLRAALRDLERAHHRAEPPVLGQSQPCAMP